MESILIVDDDSGFQELLKAILAEEGYRVQAVGSVAESVALGSRKKFDLVLSDLRLPDGDGLKVLRWWKEHSPETPVVVITAFGTIDTAVEAMKLGAADYLQKPLANPEQLTIAVRKVLDQHRIAQERDLLREREDASSCDGLVGDHPKMIAALDLARKVAPTNASVLLTGESGTGKEVFARWIHRNSPRSNQAFVPVNCAALAPSLIESELFGHEKGAFTGAANQHVGKFERADGGTLFLDEIGELDANLQTKLLRVLQDGTFERVGGSREITVDVRIIAATNRDLKRAVADRHFRSDLFYRLDMFPIELPPLRERRSDIPKMARLFLERAARKLGKSPLELTREAEDVLLAYAWPGNVRELENLMERTAILCNQRVDACDLPIRSAADPNVLTLKGVRREVIEEALRRNEGNRARAAKQLGVSLRTLQYHLRKFRIAATDN